MCERSLSLILTMPLNRSNNELVKLVLTKNDLFLQVAAKKKK